jgi:hypothetical protein
MKSRTDENCVYHFLQHTHFPACLLAFALPVIIINPFSNQRRLHLAHPGEKYSLRVESLTTILSQASIAND